jgi:serine phosphatase RsbU (regulator of sigma subunit)
VARAAHDYLRTERGGQVSAELTLISVDLETKTIVVTRNSQCPVLIAERAGGSGEPSYTWRALDAPAEVVGVHSRSRPVIAEWPLTPEQTLVAFTDGVLHAGERRGHTLDIRAVLEQQTAKLTGPAQDFADALLAEALSADDGRPGDDTTVVVVRVADRPEVSGPEVRRMTVTFPLG